MQNLPQWHLSWGLTFDHPDRDLQARLNMNTQTGQLASGAYTIMAALSGMFAEVVDTDRLPGIVPRVKPLGA